MTSDIVTLGALGEEVVLIWLTALGEIKQSEDKYDSEKDLVFEGHEIEVKTQCRFKSSSPLLSTHFRPVNITKCMRVATLIFVEYDESDYIQIWRPLDREHYTDYTIGCGTRMRGWYINSNEIGPGCSRLAKLKLPTHAKLMREFSRAERFSAPK